MLKGHARYWMVCGLLLSFTAATASHGQELVGKPTKLEGPLSEFVPDAIQSPEQARRPCWVSGDFLFGFLRGVNVPVLASTSPVGTSKSDAGVLGSSSTNTLFGGWLTDDLRAGFRIQAGAWLGGEHNLGVEAGFLFVGGQTARFFSDDLPILARPYTDATNNSGQAVLVAFPGSSTGSLDIRVSSGNFYSVHVDLVENAIDTGAHRLVALVGYRHYRYDESLSARQILSVTDPNFAPGTSVVSNDSFAVRNEFHGYDVGFRSEHAWGNFTLELLGKVAAGKVLRRVDIHGDQVTTSSVGSSTQPAGVLALSSNSGTFSSHDWKVFPEIGATVGCQVRPNLHVRLGYSFLLLNGVARAVDHLDTTLNPNLFPPPNGLGGPGRPAFNLHRTDMWIQSINLGVVWTY